MSTTVPERVELGTTALNKDWYLDVNSGTTAPTWIAVNGITDFQAAMEVESVDDTDFASDGWSSEQAVGKSWSIDLTVKRARQRTANAFDPGQELLRLRNGEVVEVRWYEMSGDGTATGLNSMPRVEAYTGFAMVKWSPEGGDNKALRTISVNLVGRGKRVSITHPKPNATA